MPTQFKVRAANLGDARSIATLSGELGYPAEPATVRERLRRILARDDQRVIVAELPDGRACAWLQAHFSEALESGPRVEIVGLVVSDGMRRRGVGRSLVAQAESWAAEISADTVVARSNAKRVESHAFYPALGFLPSKTQVVYRKRAGI
ncbi:MAG TPA: GNAT family N-acetyltransferase [Opitutaceae bacterium]|nr:GNAT family N-acetyltransferase [Opitutaceae bacterium]